MRVSSRERRAIHGPQSWVIVDAQEIRQNGLIYFLRERLPFGFSPLAVTLEAVPQHFMEEYRRRASGKQRGSIERLGQWRIPQCFQIGSHFFFLGGHFFLRWQSVRFRGFERLDAHQVHSIVRARVGFNDQPRHQARRLDFASFA